MSKEYESVKARREEVEALKQTMCITSLMAIGMLDGMRAGALAVKEWHDETSPEKGWTRALGVYCPAMQDRASKLTDDWCLAREALLEMGEETVTPRVVSDRPDGGLPIDMEDVLAAYTGTLPSALDMKKDLEAKRGGRVH